MPSEISLLPKPRSDQFRPELIRLAPLTRWRKLFRILVSWLSRFLVFLWTRPKVFGLENLPDEGPALYVSNHLGDADLIIGFTFAPITAEPVAKIELYDINLLGWLLDSYGMIWVHRGQPDRRAIRVILEALDQGRIVGIAPEGRESLTGSLEEGTRGAAYLALKADVPIIPITFTGTENKRVFGNMKRLRRTDVSVKIGTPFKLESSRPTRESITKGTELIMNTLANQLPPEYRGVYDS
jgi:1-acyl-sn-glycerol-3-phosphate acyltransferase